MLCSRVIWSPVLAVEVGYAMAVRAAQVRERLCGPDKLLPAEVSICAYVGNCRCFRGQWGTGGVPRECPLHGKLRATAHDELLRRAIDLVFHLDSDARMLPQCVVKFKARRGRFGGRFGRCGGVRMYIVDLIVLLGNGAVIALECDGRSHDNKAQRLRDQNKQNGLIMCDVIVRRLCIRDAKSKTCILTLQQLYDRELAKVRAFVKALM